MKLPARRRVHSKTHVPVLTVNRHPYLGNCVSGHSERTTLAFPACSSVLATRETSTTEPFVNMRLHPQKNCFGRCSLWLSPSQNAPRAYPLLGVSTAPSTEPAIHSVVLL